MDFLEPYRQLFEAMLFTAFLFLPWILRIVPELVMNGVYKDAKKIEIRRHFGALELLGSIFGLLFTFLIFFLCISGVISQYSQILEVLDPGIVNWLQQCVFNAGFNVPEGDEWFRLRIFLAAIGSATFVIPYALMANAVSIRTSRVIRLTTTSIAFPSSFWVDLKFRSEQAWSELIEFEVNHVDNGKRFVVMRFTDGRFAKIPREDLSDLDLNALLAAVVRQAPHAVGLGEELEEKTPQDAEPTGTKVPAPTPTELWNDDFRRHYLSTTFIPLAVDDTLQDNRFKVVDHLASSAMSATYLARMENGSLVILKESVASAESDAGKKAAELFLKECEHLSKLDHPKIANVIDSFSEKGRCYLALEYVPGKDLSRFIRQAGPALEEDVLNWALQICETMIYLHSQDPPLIHRDLTPHNLVIDNAREIHVIDFGAANRFLSNATGTMIGKQSYIAPEQLRGKAVPQSDIYAFGATLFYLLTKTEPEPLTRCSPQSIRPAISDGLNSLVEYCTEFEVADRAPNAEEIKQRLTNLIEARTERHKITIPTEKKDYVPIKLKNEMNS